MPIRPAAGFRSSLQSVPPFSARRRGRKSSYPSRTARRVGFVSTTSFISRRPRVISRFDPFASGSHLELAMYHEYPIEQLARGTGTRFQRGFARMTMHLLPEFKEAA